MTIVACCPTQIFKDYVPRMQLHDLHDCACFDRMEVATMTTEACSLHTQRDSTAGMHVDLWELIRNSYISYMSMNIHDILCCVPGV